VQVRHALSHTNQYDQACQEEKSCRDALTFLHNLPK
jgi:hypothetical protein